MKKTRISIEKIYAVWSIILAVCLGGYFFNTYIANLLHIATDVIAPGRSDSKTLFFLVYGLILSVMCMRYVGMKFGGRKINTHVFLWISVIGSFGVSFLTYIWFLAKYQVPSTYSLIVNNDAITSTWLLHNHFTKGALAFVVDLFTTHGIPNVDSGMALVNLIPRPVFFVQSILALSTVFFFVWLYRQKMSDIATTTPWRGFCYLIVYWLASFMIIKGVFDGGVLDAPVVPGIVFFLALVYPHKRFTPVLISMLSIGLITCMGWLYYTGYFAGDQNYVYGMYTILVNAALLAIFYMGYTLAYNRLHILTLILLVIFIYPQVNNRSFFGSQTGVPIEIEGAWVSSYMHINEPNYKYMGKVGDLRVYHFTAPPSSLVRVGDLIKKSGFISSYNPVTIPYAMSGGCFPHAGFNSSTAILHSTVPVSILATSTSLYGFSLTPIGDTHVSGMYTYKAIVSLAPCLPMTLVSYTEIFKGIGLNTFFLSDFVGNSNDPLNLIVF